ncbi:MAG: hypothetical protein ACR2PL_21260, partial [Dehalococcoidia bacterium]
MLADELLSYVFDGRMYPIASECAGWVDESRPFRAFVDRYRDKIRKKLRVCGDEEARRDLQVELATAFALLQEHRFSIEYELYASGKQRGPDLSVIFKDHIRFNVEVTRLRGGGAEPEGKPGGKQTNGAGKVTATICAKLGQMPPSVANILVLAADSAVYSPSDIDGVMKELKTQAERKDDAFFARRGLDESRD